MSGDEVAAVKSVTFSRETHVQWRDWLRAHPDDPRAVAVGDADYHAKAVEEYDVVLRVLAAQEGERCEMVREAQEAAWDECVRSVAGVAPDAIHNPYRDARAEAQ